LQKDENQGWELFEDLAKKTIQWQPTPQKSRNINPISSKGDLIPLSHQSLPRLKLLA